MKTLFSLLVVVVVVTAIGCSAQQNNALVGQWKGPARLIQIQFFADGRFIQTAPGSTMSGTYKITQENQKGYLNLDFEIITETYEIVSIDNNVIKLKEGNIPRQLERISEN
jgi:hypothetical protein